ncbi:MAG: hypothetical protein HZA50_09550 [Planctomycetes bacterium]|nr:hypothetical protein [Planctomycetota bacterium]
MAVWRNCRIFTWPGPKHVAEWTTLEADLKTALAETESIPATHPATRPIEGQNEAAEGKQPLDNLAKDYSQKIAGILPKGWTVEAKSNRVIVHRIEKVEVFWWTPSSSRNDKPHNDADVFEVHLDFAPAVTAAQVQAMREANQDREAKLDELRKQLRHLPHKIDDWNPRTEKDKTLVAEFYRTEQDLPYHRIPDGFGDNFSVTMCDSHSEPLVIDADAGRIKAKLVSPSNWWGIHPPAVNDECVNVVKALQGMFSAVPATQPAAEPDSGPASQPAQWHKSSAGLESRMESKVWNKGEAIRFIILVRNRTDKDIKVGGFMYHATVTLDGTAFQFYPQPILSIADTERFLPVIKAGWTGEFGAWYYPIKDSFTGGGWLEAVDANGKWIKPNLKPGRHTAAFELGPIQTGTIEFDLPAPATQPATTLGISFSSAEVDDAEAARRVKASEEIASAGKLHMEIILVDMDDAGNIRWRTFRIFGGHEPPQPSENAYWLQNKIKDAESLVNILLESGFFKRAKSFDVADPQYPRSAVVVRFDIGKEFYDEAMPWDNQALKLLKKMQACLAREKDSEFGHFLDKANRGPIGPCKLETMTELARQIAKRMPAELALSESGRSDAPYGWSGETKCEFLSFCMTKNKKFSVIQLWLTPTDYVSSRYMVFASQSGGPPLRYVKDNPDGRLMFVSRIPFGPEDEAWKKFEKKILELSFAPINTHGVTPAAEKFRRTVTTAPAGNDRLPGSLVGLDKAVAFPNFILAAVCLAKNDAVAVAGETSQSFEIIEVLDGVDKAGRGYPINYRFDESPKFKERAILKGEQVIWIVRLSGSDCYNGILALPDTPENRKVVKETAAKSGNGIWKRLQKQRASASAPATQPK